MGLGAVWAYFRGALQVGWADYLIALEFSPLYEPLRLAHSFISLPPQYPMCHSVPFWVLCGPEWRETSRFLSEACPRWTRSWHRRPNSSGRLWAHRDRDSDRRDPIQISCRISPNSASCPTIIVNDKIMRWREYKRQVHRSSIRARNTSCLWRAKKPRDGEFCQTSCSRIWLQIQFCALSRNFAGTILRSFVCILIAAVFIEGGLCFTRGTGEYPEFKDSWSI